MYTVSPKIRRLIFDQRLSWLNMDRFLHCPLSLAAQCIVIGPVCLCVCLLVCLFVCGSVIMSKFEIACIDLHQTGSVGEGSDHLQLIKFWRSRAPGNGVCGGAKIFGSALLQPARSVCVSPSTFFILNVRIFRCPRKSSVYLRYGCLPRLTRFAVTT